MFKFTFLQVSIDELNGPYTRKIDTEYFINFEIFLSFHEIMEFS